MTQHTTLEWLVRLGLGVSVSLACVVAGCSASGGPVASFTAPDDASTAVDAPAASAEAGADTGGSTDASIDTSPTCAVGQTSCVSDAGAPYCANTKSDNANCGACGNVCAGGLVCSSGACIVSCPGTEVNCGGSCIQPATDAVHCGAEAGCGAVDGGGSAGVACGLGSDCVGGACIPSCLAPLIICGSACIDPRIDPLHCGGCAPCATESNATNPVCRAGTCFTGTCTGSFRDCNGNYGDGCEVDSLTDFNSCGFCGNACATGLDCIGGACTSTNLFFDSLTGTISPTSRGIGDSCGTQINVATTQDITAFAVKNNLSTVGNLRFMIWTHPAHALVYVSGPKPFPTGDSWKQSDHLSFVLMAGQSYDIGAISDVAGAWDFDTTVESSFGITTAISNPNFSSFTTPTIVSSGGADCGIRLFH